MGRQALASAFDVGRLDLAPVQGLQQNVVLQARRRGADNVGDDSRDGVSVPLPDIVKRILTTLVFRRVVQQGRDGLVLVAAILHHQRGNGGLASRRTA